MSARVLLTLPIRTYREQALAKAPFLERLGPGQGKPPDGENVPPAAASTVERREAAAPLRHWGARASPGARRTAIWSAGTYVIGARRLPALHVPRFEGDGKMGKGGPGSPKSEVAGQHSVVLPGVARRASEAGAARAV
jgi:hypothetical protein